MTAPIDEATLVKEYTPVLVLYPEIPTGTSRPDIQENPRVSPLPYNYHPRDIKMVLENCNLQRSRFLPRSYGTYSWDDMLDKMEEAEYLRNLDILPGVSRKKRQGVWGAYANIAKNSEDYRRVCYARVVEGKNDSINKDQIMIQYWYAYFYNDFWNTHEMDWETVMIVFQKVGNEAQPRVCAYSAHIGGYWLPWPQVGKAKEVGGKLTGVSDGTHPIVYVANGSHANYFHGPGFFWATPPGERQLLRFLWPIIGKVARILPQSEAAQLQSSGRVYDYTMSWEEGDRHLVEALLIPNAEKGQWTDGWRWLNQKGRWGSPGRLIALGSAGPKGPTQSGEKWDDPFRWIDNNCTLAPSREQATPPTRWQP